MPTVRASPSLPYMPGRPPSGRPMATSSPTSTTSGYAQPIARGKLMIIPAGGGEPWTVPGGDNIPSLPPGAAAIAWSPDGTRIAAGWPGRIFHVADGVGAPVGVEALPGPARNWFVVAGGWAPDGKHFAVTDGTEYGMPRPLQRQLRLHRQIGQTVRQRHSSSRRIIRCRHQEGGLCHQQRWLRRPAPLPRRPRRQ